MFSVDEWSSCVLPEGSAFNDDIRDWVVSAVTDMSNMFALAETFNQDVGDWDVAAVTDMSGMRAKTFNQDIGEWDVGAVTDISYAFYNAKAFDHGIGNWVTANVTDMSELRCAASIFATVGNISSTRVEDVPSDLEEATSAPLDARRGFLIPRRASSRNLADGDSRRSVIDFVLQVLCQP